MSLLRPATSHRAPRPPDVGPQPTRRIALAAVIIGLVTAGVFAVVGAWDWFHVRGWPEEQAQVVRATATGDAELCGRSSSKVYELTWTSQDPPDSLPASFTDREGCNHHDVGDTASVVRVVEGDGTVHTWVDPATSVLEAAFLAVGGFVLGSGGFAVVALLVAGWSRWRWRRARTRTT
jgi:hypothetical protein